MLLSAAGCAKHLVYVYDGVLGIDVSIASDGNSRLTFGYDTQTFAVVPKHKDQTTKKVEAMTLVSVSHVEADGLNEVIFNHSVSTGEAAREAVKDKNFLKQVRKAVYDETEE
jgi:hypothetical protein